MISTPLEEKIRAFLETYKDGTNGTTIDFIKKIYTDRPREDVSRSNFPRLQVSELPSPSELVHATSIREYDAHFSVIIYVDMDTPLTLSSATAGPEVACAQIGYILIDLFNDYWKTKLFTGEELYIRSMTYNRMGVDNEYFNNLNIYKGSVEVAGIYWR